MPKRVERTPRARRIRLTVGQLLLLIGVVACVGLGVAWGVFLLLDLLFPR